MIDDANLIKKVMAFVSADSWEKWEAMIRRESATLLSNEADALLEQMLQVARNDQGLATTVELRRNLLRRCREDGIDSAFAHLRGPIDDDGQEPPTPPDPLTDPEADAEETLFHPDVYRGVVLRSVLENYTGLLEMQRGSPLDYGQTQLNRAKVLHQLAGLKGEKRHDRMKDALTAYDDAMVVLENSPRDYARTQSNRAILLYQLAVLPGEDLNRLHEALQAYDDALSYLDSVPHAYGKTQLNRVALLRDIAGLPGENRAERLYQALDGLNRALQAYEGQPLDFAKAQMHRANLLRELAGLRDEREQRPQRMFEALDAYDEVCMRLPHDTPEYAVTQTNRASLLQEIANLPGEDRRERLRSALAAIVAALKLLERNLLQRAQYRTAQRMAMNTRRAIINAEGEDTFNAWWSELYADQIPTWLEPSPT